MARREELDSMIDQLQPRLDKAMAGGSEREINSLRKEIRKFEKERDDLVKQENSCGCEKK